MESKFEEMLCPVCGEYDFVDDTDLEKADPDYEGYTGDQCSHCGWIYDIDQTHNPDLKEGNNKMSLNEYIAWFKEKVKQNPDYDYSEENYTETPHLCPICGKYEFPDINSFELCPQCGWEDDDLMENEPDSWAGCSNDLCLNDFKTRYKKLIDTIPNYSYKRNGFGN